LFGAEGADARGAAMLFSVPDEVTIFSAPGTAWSE
jgi:hypothetical protein